MSTNLNVNLKKKYVDSVNGTMNSRYRVVCLVAIALELLFNVLDRVVYPDYADNFLLIRIISCVFLALTAIPVFLSKTSSRTLFSINGGAISLSAGFAAMAMLSDGTSSNYFNGVNLVLIGMCAVNSFNYKANAASSIIQVLLYNAGAVWSFTPFNFSNLVFANLFMGSTALLTTLMSRFSAEQHYQAFIKTEQLALIAKRDPMTGVLNRSAFLSALQTRLEEARTRNEGVYLVLFDIDHFKELNDRFGHLVGDKVITTVVDITRERFRSDDVLGRFGGDEFLLLFNSDKRDVLEQKMNGLLKEIHSIFLPETGVNFSLSISAGIVRFDPTNRRTAQTLVEKADALLYAAKQQGRNRFIIEAITPQ